MATISSYPSSSGCFAANVAERLKEDIFSHKLKSGTKLLPLRKLAEEYNVSYPIMQRAVNLLCSEGLLSSRQGSGVFVKKQDAQSSSFFAGTPIKTLLIAFCGFEKYFLMLPFYSRLLYGIEKEASRQGIKIEISLLRDTEQFCQTNAYTRSNDFLLIGHHLNQLAPFFKGKTVVCAMGIGASWCDHVSYDNHAIGVLAANQLVARGHKHLVSINIHPEHGDERCRAFNDHARSLGAAVSYFNDPKALIETHLEQYIDSVALQNWVKQIENASPRPSGAFVVDLIARPLCDLLTERGIKPGRDIEIVTSNWCSPSASGTHYRPLNIELHPEEIGTLAISQLRWRHENPNANRVTIKIEPEIENTSKVGYSKDIAH